jgi:hypothetical protein
MRPANLAGAEVEEVAAAEIDMKHGEGREEDRVRGETRQRKARQAGHAQRPCQTGRRFSEKARGPSRASSEESAG